MNTHFNNTNQDSINRQFTSWAFGDEVENTSDMLENTNTKAVNQCSDISLNTPYTPCTNEEDSLSSVGDDIYQTQECVNDITINEDVTNGNTNIFDTTEVIIDNSQLSVENLPYKYCDYSFSLSTDVVVHDKVINYLSIKNIFRYVTLGKYISSEYIDTLDNYVEEVLKTHHINIDNLYKVNKSYTSFSGVIYNRKEWCIPESYYGYVAKACLEWAFNNPEKLCSLNNK